MAAKTLKVITRTAHEDARRFWAAVTSPRRPGLPKSGAVPGAVGVDIAFRVASKVFGLERGHALGVVAQRLSAPVLQCLETRGVKMMEIS